MIEKINNLQIVQAKVSASKRFQVRLKDGGFTDEPGIYTLYITILGYSVKLNGFMEVTMTDEIKTFVQLESLFSSLEEELTESTVLQTVTKNISESLNKTFTVTF